MTKSRARASPYRHVYVPTNKLISSRHAAIAPPASDIDPGRARGSRNGPRWWRCTHARANWSRGNATSGRPWERRAGAKARDTRGAARLLSPALVTTALLLKPLTTL